MNRHIITFSAAAMTMLMSASAQATDILFRLKNAKVVAFNHDTHFEKFKDCKVCHNAIFDRSKKRSYPMAEMEKGFACGA
ncbi:hypothetical protein FY034_18360 (plasmid) [Trichlorobacter lovleyi]|uniref:c(7)-type cytochrome triheme domain-containing protein n=1 Tax=Trichlorobacter lovleyi TaxID=313985 RepID=UPI00223FFE15|nr:c(7)-type cytochrome triheme domain-containing protein [Trichlorobacter lovleyi]QOX80961.1 hypothetical protein FY034_18360 [Trichlorobacter lovleyi]